MPIEFTPEGQRDLESLTPDEQLLLARALDAELAAIHAGLRRLLGGGSPGGLATRFGVLRLRGCVVLLVVSVQGPEAAES